MKKIKNIVLIIPLLISLNGCKAQINKNYLNNDTMRYFNINKYRDWKIDSTYNCSKNRCFLKKGDERVEINYYSDYIQVILSNNQNPYKEYMGFDKDSNRYQGGGKEFYQTIVGKWKEYDEKGNLIKETNYDEPYNLSINDLESIIKENTDLDLMNKNQIYIFLRGKIKPYLYSIWGNSKGWKNVNKLKCYVIDDKTGKIVFVTSRNPEEKRISPVDEYLKSLEEKKEVQSTIYKTYKGKNYTKSEWEAFEEKQFKLYKKDKGFKNDK